MAITMIIATPFMAMQGGIPRQQYGLALVTYGSLQIPITMKLMHNTEIMNNRKGRD